MKKLTLTENQLIQLIERTINEQDRREHWPPRPTYEQTQDLKQIKACVNTIEGYEYTAEGRSPYIGGTFMTEFMWHLKESFDKDAENAKEIEYKIKKCFRNTVFWDEYGKALRFLGDDRRFRSEMKRLERGPIEEQGTVAKKLLKAALTKKQIEAIMKSLMKNKPSLLDKIWKAIKDITYETEDGKKVIGLLDREKVMRLLKKLF